MSCLRLPTLFKKSKISAKGKMTANCQNIVNDESDSDSDHDQHKDGSSSFSLASTTTSNIPQKIFADSEKSTAKVVAVLVTLSSGSSYDEMFRENRPTTVPGECVSTYSLACEAVAEFHSYLSSAATPGADTTWQKMIADIRQVQPDSVTLNWECCSGCGDEHFPILRSRTSTRTRWCPYGQDSRSSPTMTLMGLALKSGFTVMCSDFSLKALIAEWSEEHLGPNPFVKIGECDHQFQLEFLPAELQNEEVPQQLQVVGELCSEQGTALVSAMSNTIVYTVNPRRPTTEIYNLKVLTVATQQDSECPEAMMCSVGEGQNAKTGVAGHVTLTYSSGGQLVTSMGHWIELTRINTSEEELMHVAARNFGQLELNELRADLGSKFTESDREECRQKWAKSHISKSVPSRMKCRTKY